MEHIRLKWMGHAILSVEDVYKCRVTDMHEYAFEDDPDDEEGLETEQNNNYLTHQQKCKMCQIHMSLQTIRKMTEREWNTAEDVLLALELLEHQFKDEYIAFLSPIIMLPRKL